MTIFSLFRSNYCEVNILFHICILVMIKVQCASLIHRSIPNISKRRIVGLRQASSTIHENDNSIVDNSISSIKELGVVRTDNIAQHIFSVAPMMDYTDRHQRFLTRLMTKQATLYTEMVTVNAILRTGDLMKQLGAELDVESPIVLQLGGSNPTSMKEAAKIAYNYGYREMNINVGCPSERVAGAGCFGAALMLEPDLVAQLSLAIGDASGRPATVKCRIGVNNHDSYEELSHFVDSVSRKGEVKHFIVHARKAILDKNFTPSDNRKIPPLKYNYVYDLVRDFPHLHFTINGGILAFEDAKDHLSHGVAGVMVGRSVVNHPFYWRNVDSMLYGQPDIGFNRRDIIEKYASYARKAELAEPRCRSFVIKPIWNMFAGEFNGKSFKVKLDELTRNKKMLVGDALMVALENSVSDDLLLKI